MSNIAIIGGGASGMIASIFASQNHHNITIFEKNNRLGKKILATGNGRCNITNKKIEIKKFHSNDMDPVKYVLDQFKLDQTLEFFESIGLLTVEGEKKNRLYPMSLQAQSVSDLLEKRIKKEKNIQIELNSHIKSISYKDNKFQIQNENESYIFDKIILATGGLAQKKLGGCDDGFNFAKQFGHSIIPTTATLVQLKSPSKQLQGISGVKFQGTARLYIENNEVTKSTGDILFTNYGLSGSTILEISREVEIAKSKNQNIHVTLDMFPQMSKQELRKFLETRSEILNTKYLHDILEGVINKKLIDYIIGEAQNQFDRLPVTLKNLYFPISETQGFDKAEVCAGGVSTSEVDMNTLESLKQKDLYLCGEVLDVDGDCGGFNLQWAWSSGYVVGSNI
jgi:predicted Rossmann fold flavoprotein